VKCDLGRPAARISKERFRLYCSIHTLSLSYSHAHHPQSRFAPTSTECMPTISIVSPAYNEEECLLAFYRELSAVLAASGEDYEIVIVDDGSQDGTASLLESLADRDPRVKALFFARNFGHQAAISAGIEHSTGDAVIIMDSDLQDPPSAIPLFLEQWRAGYQVVYAIRVQRKEGLLKRLAYTTFYRALALISEVQIPRDSGDFSLIDRKVITVINQCGERCRYVRGLRAWAGFKQIGVKVERYARFSGVPKFSLRKLVRLASSGILSFSSFPLRIVSLVGFILFILSMLYFVVIGTLRLAGLFYLPGWASIVCLVSLFGGLQLMAIGIVGEYVGKIFDEVKCRPLYVILKQKNL
jgi:glycosyltransferase involved in cell wall biosynthesis